MKFSELNLIEPIQKALKEKGYTHPTPIQKQSIPILLKGNDLLGCAQTGTGKTASFAIPILQLMHEDPQKQAKKGRIKALIVTPTRELAIQIADSFTEYGKYTGLKNVVIFGGVGQRPQTEKIKQGVDILVATPGRLLDLMNQGYITLKDIEFFTLDEADHMLEMGFIHDVKKIIAKLPPKRQSLFFSATMPPNIAKLAQTILQNPQRVTIEPEQATAERVTQAIYFVNKSNKIKLLTHILETAPCDAVLVFARTKHGSNKIVKLLLRSGITAEAIHGNKSQTARQKALENFKSGKTKVLVATDIAARGIDVSELELVINYDLPNVAETYVHRIGRTGRAKASGMALSFCDAEEKNDLLDIQRLIKQELPIIETHPYAEDKTLRPLKPKRQPKPKKKRWGRR